MNVKTYLTKAKELYPVLSQNPPYGCTEAQVQAIEQEIGWHLPGALREFLLWMGCDDTLFDGSDWGCGAMRTPSITEDTREVLQNRNSLYQLPDDALVILFHQAAHFFFIRLGEGENPPVYYAEFVKDVQVKEYALSLSACIEDWIQAHIRWKEERKQRQEAKPTRVHLERNQEDVALQAKLETVEGAQQVAAVLQEIEGKLQTQGQGQLMQVIEQSRELARQGKLVGLEAFLVRYASLPAEQVVEKVLLLQTVNQYYTSGPI